MTYEQKQYLEFVAIIVGILGTLGVWKWLIPAAKCYYLKKTLPARTVWAALVMMPEVHASQAAGLKRVEEKVDRLENNQMILAATARARSNSDPSVGMFECDAEGKNIDVSDTYCRYLLAQRSDLLGWKFMTFVHPDDRDDVREEWLSCLREQRKYAKSHKMVRTDGMTIHVHVTCTPIPHEGPPQKWVGVLRIEAVAND